METILLLSKRIARRSVSRLCSITFMSTYSDKDRIAQLNYISPVDAEPLHRYRQGGYHTIALGDYLKAGRYKVLHKLGWGGYSTVWAARDRRENTYVAIKISVANRDCDGNTREPLIMKELASHHPYPRYTVHFLDGFELKGPNGTHQCVVFELLGPNIPDTIEEYFPNGRLPGKLAKIVARQSLIGLDDLHRQQIGHGDLHSRNLVFTMPCMDHLTEEKFIQELGKPEIGFVRRCDGQGLEPGVPEYIVRPISCLTKLWNPAQSLKIIDFGESFSRNTIPRTLHTPLSVRAPEVIFQDHIDYRVDLWSMGCMLFELFVGQPPFDTILITPTILVGQMREMATNDLPERWRERWKAMTKDEIIIESTGADLQEWLEDVYFNNQQSPDLTRDDILKLGGIIGRLLKFEPGERASAREILEDPWLDQ